MQFNTLCDLSIFLVGSVVHLVLMDHFVEDDRTSASGIVAASLLVAMARWRPVRSFVNSGSSLLQCFVFQLAELVLVIFLVEVLVFLIWPSQEFLGFFVERVKEEHPAIGRVIAENRDLCRYLVAAFQALIITIGQFCLIKKKNKNADRMEEEAKDIKPKYRNRQQYRFDYEIEDRSWFAE